MQEIHQLEHETRCGDAENPAGRTMAAMVPRMARMAAAVARNVDQCGARPTGVVPPGPCCWQDKADGKIEFSSQNSGQRLARARLVIATSGLVYQHIFKVFM